MWEYLQISSSDDIADSEQQGVAVEKGEHEILNGSMDSEALLAAASHQQIQQLLQLQQATNSLPSNVQNFAQQQQLQVVFYSLSYFFRESCRYT